MDSRFNTSMTKSKKKQFLFFRRLPPPPKGEFGGLEKLMFDWFERVDYNTSEVVLVVTKGWGERFKSEADQRQLSLKVEELPFDYFKIGPLQRFFDMFNFLKSYRPAGILFFQGYFEEFGMPEILAAALKTKGHVFMHENMGSIEPPKSSSKKYFGFIPGIGLWWQYYMFCIRFRANICKNILTVSEEIKDRYINWWKYPKNKVMVAYHGVDSKIFFPDLNQGQVLRQKFNLPLQDPVFMTMSRITSIKRLDRAIEAFNIVFQEKSNVHLVLFGSGPLERECQELAARLPCFRHVHFLGQVNNPSDYLKMADYFVLSSDNEGLSIALMEAMATGLIAISTNCAGSSEVIMDGKTGYIVGKSVESLTEGMRKALNLSANEGQEIRQSAMDFIRGNFDIDHNVNKVFKTIGIN